MKEYIPMTADGRASLIAIAVLWTISAVVVVLRSVARFSGIGMGIDDYLALVACLLSGSTIGLNATVFTAGVGWDYLPTSDVFAGLNNNMEYILKVTFGFTLIYLWCLAALKMSQLFFYLRAFGNQLRIPTYVAMGIVVSWAIAFTLTFIFLCDPIEQQWTVERIGKCKDQVTVLKWIIMTNVVTDLMIVLLPVKTVWGLQMRRTEKIAVLTCFALGFGCCIIGIARFIIIFQVDLTGNLTGTSLTTFMLCSIELMLAGICINTPGLRPFYIRYRAKYGSSNGQSAAETGKGNTGSHSRHLNSKAPGSNYTAWIELHDKDGDRDSNDDGDSERKLTCGAPDSHPKKGIQVSTDWVIERD